MDTRRVLAGAALALPLLALTPAMSVYAAGRQPILVAQGGAPKGHPHARHGTFGFSAALPAAAKYLGLSQQALMKDMQGGKSLAEIATGAKKTVAGLESAMTAAVRANIQSQVKAKKLTKAQAATQEKQLAAFIKQMVTRKGFGPPPGGGSYPGGGSKPSGG